ncbi:trimethylamine-N-oxide reductase [Salmonella enterica subsp. arizonae]|uniref:Trimethylamine-N-oxide reductase n=1 Tax=Salmonella enterica subsp. arizonae TaxID=59203 RepID=A0A379T600_SALER|nr:trimethylamine-N-oxide reductase [Salmonella enterica subsp. arizonae]
MKNKDTLHVSRRRFLAQLGGLTVAGMLGPSLLTPRSARAADAATSGAAAKEGILTGSHWGGDSRHGGRRSICGGKTV